MHDTRGAPPPQVACGQEADGAARRVGEVDHIEPGPEARGQRAVRQRPPAEAQRMQHLEEAGQVAGDDDEERTEQPAGQAQFAVARREQVDEQRVGGRDGKPEPQRYAQVEGHRSGRGGQCRQVPEQDVTEVVVGDGISGQPGIRRRQTRRAQDRVEEGKLHGLLGRHDIRVEGPHQRPHDEARQEEGLRDGDRPQVRRAARFADPTRPALPCPDRCSRQNHNARQRTGQPVRPQPDRTPQPEGEARDQDAQRPRQAQASIREAREDPPGHRQRQEAQHGAG